MQFYKIEAEITNMTAEEIKVNEDDHKYTKTLQTKLTVFHEMHGKDCLIFISSMRNKELILLGASVQGAELLNKLLPAFLSAIDLECCDISFEEITFGAAKALSDLGTYNDYNGRRDLFERLEMEALTNGMCGIKYTENLIDEDMQKDELIQKAVKLLCCYTLVPELERIYQPAKRAAPGHPVHYLIQSDDDDVAKEITEILLSALYANGRLQSRRYCDADLKGIRRLTGYDADGYSALYKTSESGALTVKMVFDAPEEDDVISAEAEKVEQVCRYAVQNRNKALTVFRLPRAAERMKAIMREHLDTMTFVEITEDDVSREMAKAFLQQSARESKIRADKALYRNVSDPLKTYSISELHIAFRSWYDNQLKTRCYTQYADFETAGKLSAKKGKPRGNAHTELDKMIGLEEAKSVICQAVDFFKAQKIFKDRGINDSRPSMHMVFTGSPGTAKTTAARLFAQIMKDNGLLSIGSLVEVGRADLVGKYVGWTAQQVKSKFKEAKGSVLFIDEAYSLVDDRDGSYGDEAISTIVQEMENQREDIVVIFAGYTDKMEEFLRKNPGLRSRVSFHVPFDDYDIDELMQILSHLAGKLSMKLADDVEDKVRPIFEAAKDKPDFGNGRFIRNLLENARMKHARRVLQMDIDNVTKDELSLLIADDFETPRGQRKQTLQIGFSA